MFQLHDQPPRQRRYAPLLALLALALASLACISSELTLTVTHQEDGGDQVQANIAQYLTDSWVAAAKEVNQQRKADFAAAGRKTDTEYLLPTSYEDVKESFDIKRYQDQGYQVSVNETGFTASRTSQLKEKTVTEEWQVRMITNPDHPEQITYRAKIWLDLTEMNGEELLSLRTQPQMPKPDLTPGSTAGGSSGGSLGGLFSSLGDLSAEVEQELSVELYYVQLAMKKSDPMQYVFTVELPGTLVVHQLDGETRGEVEGSRVTLVLGEEDITRYAGKKATFTVESILKDCSLACDAESHQVWDGDESGVSCTCLCEAGWTMVEGAGCAHCDEVCRYSDPNMVRNLAKCQTNQCACQCAEGMILNQAGTACVTVDEYDAWVADLERDPDGGPSAAELSLLFEALLDPDNTRDVNQMPGWFLLTSGERDRLLDFLEALGLAVDRSQLTVDLGPDMTTDERYQRIQEGQNYLELVRQRAIQELEDQITDRRNKQKVIIQEIQGNSGLASTLLKLPEYYQMLFKTPKELATEYVEGKLTDAVKDRLKKEAYGESPPTIEDAAAELIKQIPQLATQDSVDHYYLYLQYYQQECQGCSGDAADIAHEKALDQLRENIRPGAKNWASPGEAYDRAFRKLNPDL